MTAKAGAPQPADRRARRRAQTRGKLLDAARTVFARQGIDATRINEITEEADVGFGSFYNHFESKDAIVAAVVEDTVRRLGERIDAATADFDDPAEVVAVAHRSLIAHAAGDPQQGWLLVRLELSHDLATKALAPYALRDIERGLQAGRFVGDDAALALVVSGGALLATVRAMLQDRLPPDAATRHAAAVLRMLGVPGDEAAEIAARPLPEV